MNSENNNNEESKNRCHRTIRIRSLCSSKYFLDFVASVGKINNKVISVENEKRIHIVSRALTRLNIPNYVALPHYGFKANNLKLASLNVRDSRRLNVRLNIDDCFRGKHVIMLQETRADVDIHGYTNYYNPGNTGTVVLVNDDI